MERALVALCALCLNGLLGGPRAVALSFGIAAFFFRPQAWLHKLVRKLNREHRSNEERRKRGLVLLAAVLALGLLMGFSARALFQGEFHFFEMFILAALIPLRASWDIAAQVRRSLQAGDMSSGRAAFEYTPVKHYLLLDEAGLARAAMELLAVNAAQKIISPIFWYMVLGLPGFFVSIFATALFEATGGDDAFSKPIKRLHEMLHFLPVRLAALLWLAASLFLPTTRVAAVFPQAIAMLVSMADAHTQALFAPANVLKLSLGGPGSAYHKMWVGSGSPKPKAADIKRAQYLFALFCLLLLILLGIFL